jgi:Zn-finger nucleic acid-binding protein
MKLKCVVCGVRLQPHQIEEGEECVCPMCWGEYIHRDRIEEYQQMCCEDAESFNPDDHNGCEWMEEIDEP